jgi:transposase
VRAGESRRMAMEGRTPVLKRSRWLLLKREENLETEQRFRLRDLLRYNLRTAPSAASNSRSITYLANCPSPNQPTIFSDEPEIMDGCQK